MDEQLQLTPQAIRVAYDWESLPKSERDSVAREIAAAARYWRQTAHAAHEERAQFRRFMQAAVTPRR